MKKNSNNQAPSIKQILISVLAAMFGVQSDKNRERDFKHGRPIHYIIGGIIFVFLFVLFVSTLVNFLIKG